MRSLISLASLCFALFVCNATFAGEPVETSAMPYETQGVAEVGSGWDAGVVFVRHAGTPVEGWQGGWQPGGYEGRVGRPYYYSVNPYGVNGPAVYGPQPAPGSACNSCGTGAWGWRGGYGFGNVYDYHFGPGFYRYREYGHARFPYYSYRSPWYFPGHPVYNRDTNFAW
jgi:hypothetical protein